MSDHDSYLSKLMYTAALTGGLFLSACGGDCGVDGQGASEASMMVGVDPGVTSATIKAAPDTTIEFAFKALQQKRLSSFLMSVVPPAEMQTAREKWEEIRKQDTSDMPQDEFAMAMAMATAEGAEETLFRMVEPYLEEAEQQLQGLAMMAPMMAAGMLEEVNAPADASAMVGTFAQKIADIDIGSEEKARRAIGVVVTAARALDLETTADVQKLTFDDAMGRLDVVYGAMVDVFDVYGLSPQVTLESIDARIAEVNGDQATVEITFSPFGMEAEVMPIEMERIDGRWFPKAPETEHVTGQRIAR